jgi:hypothetical protein
VQTQVAFTELEMIMDAHYRRTKNLLAVLLLLGHTKLESTVRYLGIEVDDAALADTQL